VRRLALGRVSVGERVPVQLYEPVEEARGAVLVVHPEGADAAPGDLIEALLGGHLAVLALDAGRGAAGDVAHFTCFNRTDAALRVQEILTALAYLRTRAYTVPGRAYATHLVGSGQAGLLCLLARALAGNAGGRTVIDASQFPCDDDAAWVDARLGAGALELPLLRRAGDLRTAATLSAPSPLWVHNAAPSFPAAWCRQAYAAAGAPDAICVQNERADCAAIVEWIS
jgi:hypothetical protein